MREERATARGVAIGCLSACLIGSLIVGCARRTPPGVVLPDTRGAGTSRDVSPPGSDRGDIEIALGVVTTAVATTLVVLGAVSAAKAAYIRGYCSAEPDVITEIPSPEYESTCVDPLGFDPFRTATVSAALSFAFAVPIAAGGGVLLRKGVKMRRAFMQQRALEKRQLSLRPWFGGPPGGPLAGARGAGLSLSLRF